MKLAVIAVLAASAGCDVLFQLQHVHDAGPADAAVFFEYDGAVPLDTSGWPTNGNVMPVPCMTGSVVNEDGDANTDECDNCPMDANDDQMDTDRDGIGDLCDPHPTYAVERLAHFDGFNGTLTTAGMTIAGSWQVTGGVLKQTNTNNIRTLFVLAGGGWREPMIELRVSGVTKTNRVENFYVGAHLIADAVPTTSAPDGLHCRVHYEGGTDDLQMVRLRPVATASAAAPLPRVTDVLSMVLAAEQLDHPPRCDAARDTKSPTELTTQLLLARDPSDPMPARFALFTINARASFQAIAIYETTYP